MKRALQAHAKEEAAALKRGGASKRLMAEERAEYAKKGVRFADGGEVSDGDHPTLDPDVRARALASVASRDDSESAAPTPAETNYKTFKEAFAANRKAGNDTFEYKGKKYTTEMARSEAPKPRAAAPAAKSERSLSQRLGEEFASMERARNAMPASASAESRAAFDKVYGEKKSAYEAAARAERGGTSVMKQKLANGGLVRRATAKSHGRMC